MGVDGLNDPRETGGTGSEPQHRVPPQGSPDRASQGADANPGALRDTPSAPGRAAREYVPQQRERPAGAQQPFSDAELVARVRGGDDSAYEELYRRHAASVRRYARTCCRDAHTAEDLTGEVFARTLQAVRGGSGPETAVRAYLLTTVRRVAAVWATTARREQLVEDFTVFAVSAAGASTSRATTDLGADVRAMHEADQSFVAQAFKTLPERWQAVLWHTAVEDESPSQVAPLLGLTANATAVLAHRAREGLRQAYLQAHVNSALTSGGECARYADRLGAHARGGLRLRADRELRKHLDECAKCRAAAMDLADVNASLKGLLPVATIGWFAAAYVTKVAGIAAVGVAGATGAAAAGTAASGSSGGAVGGAVVSEGLGLPAKVAIATSVVVAGAGVALAATLMGNGHHPTRPVAKPPASPLPVPVRTPAPAKPEPVTPPPVTPTHPPAPAPTRAAVRHHPAPPKPTPEPRPESPSPTPPAPRVYEVNALPLGGWGGDTSPSVRPSLLAWFWQRHGLTTGGTWYADGVTVHAPSTLTIDLNRACFSYDAMAGLDGLSLGVGAVRFLVYGDDSLLYESEVVKTADHAVPVHADLTGHKTVRLVVQRADDGSFLSIADWAEARISCR